METTCDSNCAARNHATTADGICPRVKVALELERRYFAQGNALSDAQQTEWDMIGADELLGNFYAPRCA